ncbi:MAG: NAD-dependent epimerase/dehydratase family protein [Gammaproteobacteria bacterium]|nr:NAD-dependent epimerase/dehydratase family protein [Gammaproteobacteria bacterium]
MKAVIAGVTGAVGSAIGRQLTRNRNIPVVGLARNPPSGPIRGIDYVQIDMAEASACARILQAHRDTTHLFYCGRATHQEQVLEDVASNLLLLENLLNVLEGASLSHVHLVQGGKVYGVHIGPFPSPAKEDDPRAPIENFNYDQEDLLRARSQSGHWSWSASRPNTLLHFSPAIARNLVSSLGTYAALCKELGAAFDFPGPQAAYHSLTQVTSIELLAEAMDWMTSDSGCANQAFNITNGDAFRWSQVWPRIADFFDMPCGSVRPMRLAEVMSGRELLWQKIVAREGLQPLCLSRIVNWGYLDATLERTWDELLCTNKTRRFGFHGWADSQELMLALFAQYREARILP